MTAISEWGWNEFFAGQVADLEATEFCVGRVVEVQRQAFHVITEHGLLQTEVTGRLMRDRKRGALWPAIGDWVVVAPRLREGRGRIEEVLERKTQFSRRAAGQREEEQVVAANVDLVLVVTSLNDDLNLRRMERYLALIWDSGAQPILVLNKVDLSASAEEFRREIESVAPGVPVLAVSARTGHGLEELRRHLRAGMTAALSGSSGVGKSTLVNALLGTMAQKTSEVREDDDKGRHTTTSRKLFQVPGGALLIDTPGMRELQLWDVEEGVEKAFEDIEAMALKCRFTDCAHEREPGCRVREAIASGEITEERFQSYLKLQAEAAAHHRKVDKTAAAEEKARWKRISKDLREVLKKKGKK